jgi:hypothetical protein
MINFKALALTATIAAGTIFGAVAPANAGTCWFDNNRGSLAPSYCPVRQTVASTLTVTSSLTSSTTKVPR